MKKFHLTVHQYRQKIGQTFGFADPEMVKRYAIARKNYKLSNQKDGDFNPFTDDPNCKNCGKNKKR